PGAQGKIAALLFAMKNFFQNHFVKQIKLWFVAKEAGLIDRQVFNQRGEFGLAFTAGKQPVIAIEGVEPRRLQSPLQAVLKKMDAALVEKHAAFLVDQGL